MAKKQLEQILSTISYEKMQTFAYKAAKNDTTLGDDILQTFLLRVLKKEEDTSMLNVTAYVKRGLHNALFRLYEKPKETLFGTIPYDKFAFDNKIGKDNFIDNNTPLKILLQKERNKKLRINFAQKIGNLAVSQKRAVILYHYKNTTIPQMAQILCKPTKVVYRALTNGRRNMRQALYSFAAEEHWILKDKLNEAYVTYKSFNNFTRIKRRVKRRRK